MFNWKYTYDDDYGLETVNNYGSCSLNEALEAIKGFEDDATIDTEGGTIVFEDGEWLMTPEEAKNIAAKEEAEEEARKAEKEAAAAAEAATFGDEIDKVNIAFIMSIARKHPAKDNGAQYAIREITSSPGWTSVLSYRGTEAEVIHADSGRHYFINMWRGDHKVTRKTLL